MRVETYIGDLTILKTSTRNALLRAGIETLGELQTIADSELKTFGGIGASGVAAIRAVVSI